MGWPALGPHGLLWDAHLTRCVMHSARTPGYASRPCASPCQRSTSG